ncbi:MAG: Tfp pilus assembly protein PilF, partial [Bacteroidota bacterium]
YAEAFYSLGSIQLQNQTWLDALESFKKSAEANRSYANAYYGAGLSFMALGNNKEAEQMFTYARDLFEYQRNQEWVNRSNSLLQQVSS